MRLKLVFTMTMCAIVLIASGCARTKATTAADAGGDEQVTVGIPLAADFRIPDIPVPAGFEFQRADSFVFQNNVIDVGRIQYAGNEEIGDVAQFYIDEMPRYNWALITVAELRSVTLNFDKPTKTCTVVLTPKVRGTQIDIAFFPKAGAAAVSESE